MSNNSIELSLNSNRDSFSHRICDDLCEVLLSYLSFEDKIRFECVSKQWKKLIFNKQFIIEVYQRSYGDQIYGLNQLLKGRNLDMFAFESVLTKCQFINQITIGFVKNTEQVLQSITNCSNNLKKISIYFRDISRHVIKQFGIKCGPKLTIIDFRVYRCVGTNPVSTDNYKLLIRLCPNLEQVFNVEMSAIIDGNQKLLPKLKKVIINSTNNEEVIKTFFNGYKDSLKHLDISLVPDQCKVALIRGISNLISLQSLNLVLEPVDLSVENIRPIADKCTQIKHLAFDCVVDDRMTNKILDTISYFTQIESLDIYFRRKYSQSDHIKSFNGCKKLTKFKIKFNQIDDHFFKDINLYLPQLTHLRATINANVSDNSLQSLSKLKNLKSVVFEPCYTISRSLESPSITDSGIRHFIDKCPSIQSIDLYRGPNISHKTIDALIALALRKPRIDFYYLFQSIENCSSIPLNDIMNNRSIPGNINLTIIYFNLNYSKRNIIQKFST